MPTVFSHPAIALAALPILKGVEKKSLVIFSGVFLTILPDLDVLAFKFGIPYNHMLGHRGLSHSILFAFLASGLFTLVIKQIKLSKSMIIWWYLFISTLSHSFLDGMTNGGLGVGLFIPFSMKRIFFNFHPIQVSTLSFHRFFGGQGIVVLQNEFLYIWTPAFFLFLFLLAISKLPTTTCYVLYSFHNKLEK